MSRVIFVPFDENCQHEFRIRSENWQKARPSKKYQIVCYKLHFPRRVISSLASG